MVLIAGGAGKTPGGPKQMLSAQKRFALTPGRLDPHFRHKGLHKQGQDSEELAHDSVTVFGFPAHGEEQAFSSCFTIYHVVCPEYFTTKL